MDTNSTRHTQYLIIKNKLTSKLNSRLEIRQQNFDVDSARSDNQGTSERMLDPRFTLSGYGTTIQTSLGEISLSPALRTEISINDQANDNTDDAYGRMRLGVTASMNTNAANNMGLFAGTYETITKSTAARATNEASSVYVYAWDEYSLSDKHSVTAFYESFRGLNQDTATLNQTQSETDISLYYNNKTMKNLSLSPYISWNAGNVLASDQLLMAVDATYSF